MATVCSRTQCPSLQGPTPKHLEAGTSPIPLPSLSPILNLDLTLVIQMSYTPPRGSCSHKPSVLLPSCACLRFMIHPLKAATSFECDGCGHHASFHQMRNKLEEEEEKAAAARWDLNKDHEAYERDEDIREVLGPGKRSRFMIEEGGAENEVVEVPAKGRDMMTGLGRKRVRAGK